VGFVKEDEMIEVHEENKRDVIDENLEFS